MKERTFYKVNLLMQPLELGLIALLIRALDIHKRGTIWEWCGEGATRSISSNIESIIYSFGYPVGYYPVYFITALLAGFIIAQLNSAHRLFAILLLPFLFWGWFEIIDIKTQLKDTLLAVAFVHVLFFILRLFINKKYGWVVPDQADGHDGMTEREFCKKAIIVAVVSLLSGLFLHAFEMSVDMFPALLDDPLFYLRVLSYLLLSGVIAAFFPFVLYFTFLYYHISFSAAVRYKKMIRYSPVFYGLFLCATGLILYKIDQKALSKAIFPMIENSRDWGFTIGGLALASVLVVYLLICSGRIALSICKKLGWVIPDETPKAKQDIT